MAEAKTGPTKQTSPPSSKGVDEDRRKDCTELVRIMKDAAGAPATMWGASIIGFGSYDLTYANGRTADWPIESPISPRP